MAEIRTGAERDTPPRIPTVGQELRREIERLGLLPAAGSVTLAMLADIAESTILGRQAGTGTGVPEALTSAQATLILDVFDSFLKGLVPASGGGTSNFLRADGTWAAPGGGGGATPLETELDFGSTPVFSASFTVIHLGMTTTALVLVAPRGKPATGSLGNEWEWDGISFAAEPGTGAFTVHAFAFPGPVSGKRNIIYTVAS